MTPIKMTLTLEKFNTHCEKEIEKYWKRKQDEVFEEILRTSPVRTWTYIRGHMRLPMRREGKLIIFEIQNTQGSPERVEKWFWPKWMIGFRKTKVVWHLRNGALYYNYWSDTYKKAILKAKGQIWV